MFLEVIVQENRKKIKKWKKKYADIYLIGLEDQESELQEAFIFKTLGREEYKFLFLNFINDMATFQEKVCESAVLYPKCYDFTKGLAGIPEIMSNYILESSGFAEGQALNLLASYREQMYEYDYQVDCMIHEAFPEISIEEIQLWNNYKTMYYLSRAEFILAGIRGYNIVTIDSVIQEAIQNEQEIAQELAKEKQYDNNFTVEEPKQEIPPEFQQQFEKAQPKEEREMTSSESDLLAMLGNNEASNGRNISNPIGDQGLGGSKMFPELSWFKAESDLKGDID